MTDKDLIDLSGETDATVWAREFCKLHGYQNKFELFRVWFDNAINAGYRRAQEEYMAAAHAGDNAGGTD